MKVIMNFADNGDLEAVIKTLKDRHPNKKAYVSGDNLVLPGGVLVAAMQKSIIEQYITVEETA